MTPPQLGRIKRLLAQGRRLRTIGIDDGPFERRRRRNVLVVGAVYAGATFEGLLTTRVRQDGHNATARLAEMLAGSKFLAQLHLCLLDGLTVGGFNVVDLAELSRATRLPCLAITRRKPDMAAIDRALQNLSRPAHRRARMDRAGPFHAAGALWFQAAGIEPELARRALAVSVIHGHMPESLRAAHLIARGVVEGQSGHRA